MLPGKLQSSTTSDRAPMATACRIGTLATSPPSYSRWDPSSTGGKMPGMAELASSAGSSRPSRRTCGRAVAMSVVTAANGRARSAKVSSAPRKSAMTVLNPVLENRWVLVCCRVRAWASSPPGKTRSRVIRGHRWDRRLAALLGSSASTAPLSAPTEVPATMSGGTSRSPSACSIPTCTAPRLPPPPSTYPTGRGRSAMLIGLAGPGRERLPGQYLFGQYLSGQGALTHDVLQRQAEGGGQRGHGEERGGGDAAGLDLAQRLRGDAGHRGDLGHAARPARLA